MSRELLERLRLPIGLLLLLIVLFVLWPRDGSDPEAAADATSAPSVVAGAPGGEIFTPQPTPSPTPSPEPTAEPTPEPTPTETEEPTAEPTPIAASDGFTAEVLACRSISGSSCNGQLGTLPAGASSFTALVRFTDANAGDVMNAILTGPAGTIAGAGYALQGSGDGYYYSVFQAGNLPAGDYTLTATRNGADVAATGFSKSG